MDIVSAFPNIMQNRLCTLNQSVMHMEQMLNSLSYKNVLARGYAIIRDSDDKIISKANDGVPASIEFADGIIRL